jgi:hypothetical protein
MYMILVAPSKTAGREAGKVHCLESGYVCTSSNLKIGLKNMRTVDFASRFVMIIESINFGPQSLLKIRISIQNQRFVYPLNHFLSSKQYEITPLQHCFIPLSLNMIPTSTTARLPSNLL